MRALIWLLILSILAVLLALLMGGAQPVVTLFWPPHTAIDFSLSFAVMVLIALFLLVQMALRLSDILHKLPQQTRRWRFRQRERTMSAHLLDAMTHYLAGRFARARTAAQNTLKQEAALHEDNTENTLPYRMQLKTLAHFMVAQSSHALQDAPQRDKAMQLAQEAALHISGNAAAEMQEGLRLRTARWLLDDHAPQQALQQLEELPHGAARRIQALRLRLQAARQTGNTEMALETARALVRHKAFSPEASQMLMAHLGGDVMTSTCDEGQLLRAWQQLDAAERAQPAVALHAAQRLLELGGSATRAQSWLLPVWEQYVQDPQTLSTGQRNRLLAVLDGTGAADIDGEWLQRIEQAHLRHPHLPALQYLMGMVCMQRQLWGKAQQFLTQAIRGLQNEPTLQRNAWRALARLAEQQNHAEQAHHAWKQAALIEG